MPDARAVDAPVLEVRHTIHAPRAAVFHAWTMPSSVKQWFSTAEAPVREVKIEPRAGGRMHIACDYKGGMWSLEGVFREVAEPTHLEFTWVSADIPASAGSVVRVEFHERGGATEVVLTQRGFPSAAKREENRAGWTQLLGQLAALVEG